MCLSHTESATLRLLAVGRLNYWFKILWFHLVNLFLLHKNLRITYTSLKIHVRLSRTSGWKFVNDYSERTDGWQEVVILFKIFPGVISLPWVQNAQDKYSKPHNALGIPPLQIRGCQDRFLCADDHHSCLVFHLNRGHCGGCDLLEDTQ